MSLSTAQLRARAVRWLSQREHSRSELTTRLLAWAQAVERAQTGPAPGRRGRIPAGSAPWAGGPGPAGVAAEARSQAGHVGDGDGDGEGASSSDRGDDSGTGPSLAQRVAEVMDQLAAQHWQSDARFVEGRVHARQARWGTRRIAMELKQHGLAMPPESREQLQRTELARAQALWARRYGAAPADAADFARQSRFLLARGFAQDTVRQVVPRPGHSPADEDNAQPTD